MRVIKIIPEMMTMLQVNGDDNYDHVDASVDVYKSSDIAL
jgi:hypothetical protein